MSMAVTGSCSTLVVFTFWVLVQAVNNNRHRLNNEKPAHVLVRHFESVRFLFIIYPYFLINTLFPRAAWEFMSSALRSATQSGALKLHSHAARGNEERENLLQKPHPPDLSGGRG
jgi:hypothetical protein